MDKSSINPATGKAYAINPATNQWDDNYWANTVEPKLKASGQISGGGGSMSSTDPAQAIKAAIQQLQEANKPAVESLQASIPETRAQYSQAKSQLQASQPSLEQKYDQLLSDIKGQQTADVEAQTKITSNELGKRGIVGSSTIAGQEIQNAVSPLNLKYTGLQSEATRSRSDSLRALSDAIANLTPQQTSDERAITNAIAQLQSGAGSQGMQAGLNLYSTNLSAQQAELQRQSQAQQQAISNALAQSNFDLNKSQVEQAGRFAEQTQPLSLDLLRAQVANTNRLASGGGESNNVDLSGLGSFIQNYLGGGGQSSTPSSTPSTFQASSITDPAIRKKYGW